MRKTLIIAVLLVIVLLTLGACTSAKDVQITYIFYDGLVFRVESDEYVEITNHGDQPQDLADWELKDISEGYPSFTFPSYILASGKSIRVYTNEYHSEWGGFSFVTLSSGILLWSSSVPIVAYRLFTIDFAV